MGKPIQDTQAAYMKYIKVVDHSEPIRQKCSCGLCKWPVSPLFVCSPTVKTEEIKQLECNLCGDPIVILSPSIISVVN